MSLALAEASFDTFRQKSCSGQLIFGWENDGESMEHVSNILYSISQ